MIRLGRRLAGLSILALSSMAAADESPLAETVDLSISAGAVHEDNLVVESLDSVSSDSGTAAVGSVDLGLGTEFKGGHRLGGGYLFEARRFDRHPAYDMDLHYAHGDYSHKAGAWRWTGRIDGSLAYLGGRRLLENRQLGLALARMAGANFYWRGRVAFQQTDLVSAPERDNDTAKAGTAAYYFLDGTEHYLSLNYRFSAERARRARFDYDEQRVGLLYRLPLPLWESRPPSLKLDWRYQHRAYLDEDSGPSGEKRRDERHRWRARLEWPVSERWELELRYERRHYESNLPAVDYVDNRLALTMTLTLL